MVNSNQDLHNNSDAEMDEVYALMMDALDGEISEEDQLILDSHLQIHPELAREWKAWQAVDTLFRTTPALVPSAEFTRRTMAKMPNPRQRLWVMTAVYGLLFLLGAIPAIGIGWIVGQIAASPVQTSGAAIFISEAVTLIQVIGDALIGGLAEFINRQPYLLGWLFVMAGLVFVWNGVYRQMMLVPQRMRS